MLLCALLAEHHDEAADSDSGQEMRIAVLDPSIATGLEHELNPPSFPMSKTSDRKRHSQLKTTAGK